MHSTVTANNIGEGPLFQQKVFPQSFIPPALSRSCFRPGVWKPQELKSKCSLFIVTYFVRHSALLKWRNGQKSQDTLQN